MRDIFEWSTIGILMSLGVIMGLIYPAVQYTNARSQISNLTFTRPGIINHSVDPWPFLTSSLAIAGYVCWLAAIVLSFVWDYRENAIE